MTYFTGFTTNVDFSTSNVEFGNANTLSIGGGSNGQVLTTNGSGNLSFAAIPIASSIANGNSNVSIASANGNITISVDTTTYTFGPLALNVTNNPPASPSPSLTGFSTGNFNQAVTTLDLTATGAVSFTGANGNISLGGAANVSLGAVGNLRITGGSNGQVLTSNGSGGLSFTTVGGGTPAGSNTQLQFNNAGAFGASANLTFADGGGTGNTSFVIGNSISFTHTSTGDGVIANLEFGIGSLANTTISAFSNIILSAGGNVNITPTGNLRLPTIANVKMAGGSNNQVLTTDGAGNLSFATPTTPKLTTATANANATISQQLTFVDAAANVTLTMPAANANTIGQVYYIKDVLGTNRTGNTITIVGDSGQLIDNGNVQIISPYNSVTIVGVSSTTWGVL